MVYNNDLWNHHKSGVALSYSKRRQLPYHIRCGSSFSLGAVVFCHSYHRILLTVYVSRCFTVYSYEPRSKIAQELLLCHYSKAIKKFCEYGYLQKIVLRNTRTLNTYYYDATPLLIVVSNMYNIGVRFGFFPLHLDSSVLLSAFWTVKGDFY